MRVAATFVGGWGHAEPLLPLANLATALGHDVVFAGQAAVVPRLQRLGFATRVVGPDTLGGARGPLIAPDRGAEIAVMRDSFFVRFGSSRARALRSMFEGERPELVICDEIDVGSIVAAEVASIPCVTVNVIAAGMLNRAPEMGDAWNGLRAANGLAADPGGGRLAGAVMVAAVPRSFRHPDASAFERLRFVRPPILDRAPTSPAATRTLVYATLGTVFNVESGDLLDRIIRATALVDADVVVTTGPQIDPAEFVDVPPRVTVERFRPQAELLGSCRAVVTHGGSGTLLAALALGVPVLVLPMGADQLDNADRVGALGVGLVLDPITATPADIATAVATLIDDRAFGERAMALAGEAASQPPLDGVGDVVALLAP